MPRVLFYFCVFWFAWARTNFKFGLGNSSMRKSHPWIYQRSEDHWIIGGSPVVTSANQTVRFVNASHEKPSRKIQRFLCFSGLTHWSSFGIWFSCCWRLFFLIRWAGTEIRNKVLTWIATVATVATVRFIATVKGQSRSDSLLLSPYHWAKLFRGIVAIVAVPMRFAMICWVVLEVFVGQIHVFPLGSWLTILYICWGCSSIFSLHGGNVLLVIPLTYLFWMGGRFIFFIWWFRMKKGRGGAGSCALHVMVNDGHGSCVDNSWIRGRSGVVRLYFQHLFSFVFFVCSLFYLFFFSQAVTSSLFIFSVVHSVFLLLKSNQTILAEWLFVMQSSAGRRVVCSARGGFSRVCYAGTLYPSNEGNPLVFWWIAVTLLWPGRGDFSASGLSTFKKIVPTSALDCAYFTVRNLRCRFF